LKRVNSIVCLVLCAAGAMTFATSTAAARAEQRQGPGEAIVRQAIDSLRKLRTINDGAQRAAIVRSLHDTLALDTLAPEALAAQWGKLDAAERKHFVSLLRELLEKLAYPRASEFFSEIDVAFEGEKARGNARMVKSVAKRKDGGAIAMNYTLAPEHGRLRIVDIELDGQSLRHQVTTQIDAVLKQGSYQTLVDQMEARLKQPDS
jgi:ABC-type transporter MlaC component